MASIPLGLPPARRFLRQVFKGIALFCVRHGIVLNEMVDALKAAMVDAALKEFSRSGAKKNISRISIMTGVHRGDVARLVNDKENSTEDISQISRVIQHWISKPQYLNESGKPRTLTYKGSESEFHALCRDVSKSCNPAAIYFELERTARIEIEGDKIKLLRYEVQVGKNLDQTFNVVARDIETLFLSLDENLKGDVSQENLHFSTIFDNIYIKDAPEVRAWIVQKGREFHRDVRAYLASRDKDVNSDLDSRSPAGVVVRVASAGIVEIPKEELLIEEE